MTTIAVKDGVMAADRQCTNTNYGTKWKCKSKIWRIKPTLAFPFEFIVGFSGGTNDMLSMIDWFENPTQRIPRTANTGGLVLKPDGSIWTFNNPRQWMAVNEPYFAIGSGTDYARGAMAHGATAKQAVQTASRYDAFTGMGVTTMHF